jgi:hypothetical protein
MKENEIINSLTNPQSFNRYSYVKGNPVNFNDPTGHAADQPLQQIIDQTSDIDAQSPLHAIPPEESDAAKKQEQKMVDQPKKVDVQEIIKALSTSGQVGSFRVTSNIQQALQNNSAFRQGFEAWLTTESGSKQFEQMSKDTNTQYTMEMSSNIGGRGETKANYFSQNPGPTLDYKNVFIMLHSDLSNTTDSFSLAVTIGHEAFHAEALGSGKYTAIGAAKINRQLDLDRGSSDIGLGYWKMKQYYKELEVLCYGKNSP